MNRFTAMKPPRPWVMYGNRVVSKEWSEETAKEKASWLNSLLDQAYEEGREDGSKNGTDDDWRENLGR